jgi:hypothetical protein
MRMLRIGRMREQLPTENCKPITADFHGNHRQPSIRMGN